MQLKLEVELIEATRITEFVDIQQGKGWFFNRTTFLCEKQVRTVGGGKSIMKYSDYKRVGNVMLPHVIVAVKEDGTTMAVREIQKWELARLWADDVFRPETVRVLH